MPIECPAGAFKSPRSGRKECPRSGRNDKHISTKLYTKFCEKFSKLEIKNLKIDFRNFTVTKKLSKNLLHSRATRLYIRFWANFGPIFAPILRLFTLSYLLSFRSDKKYGSLLFGGGTSVPPALFCSGFCAGLFAVRLGASAFAYARPMLTTSQNYIYLFFLFWCVASLHYTKKQKTKRSKKLGQLFPVFSALSFSVLPARQNIKLRLEKI